MPATKRLFIGTPLDTEKKMLLSQSPVWKQIQILPKEEQKELIEVHFQGKDYLGLYFSEDSATLAQLHEINQYIQARLHAYCPEYESEKIKSAIFSQLFIA